MSYGSIRSSRRRVTWPTWTTSAKRAWPISRDLTKEEQANTVRRIEENRAIVRWVQGSMHERAEAYRVALERLVIAAPSPIAAEAERQLGLLAPAHQRLQRLNQI